MPYNPAGLFSLIASYFATPGATIRTEQHNPVFEDVASALSSVLLRDGRAPMTGALNMNGFPINNVVAGNSPSSVATLAQAMPIGAVIDYALKTPPSGWAFCMAQILLANTPYQTLRTALINDAFPYGQDGSGNPKLPDARGCVVAGFDAMGGSAANRLTGAFGVTVGAQTVTITTPNLPPYTPSGSVSTTTVFNSAQQFYGGTSVGGIASGGNYTSSTFVASIDPNLWGLSSSSSFNGSAQGGSSTPLNNVQPTIIMNKIIKVSYDV